MTQFKEMVKEIMNYHDWNQDEMAAHYKVGQSQVCRWLAGIQIPRAETYLQIFLDFNKIKSERSSAC